jgi:hypothetical protein
VKTQQKIKAEAGDDTRERAANGSWINECIHTHMRFAAQFVNVARRALPSGIGFTIGTTWSFGRRVRLF